MKDTEPLFTLPDENNPSVTFVTAGDSGSWGSIEGGLCASEPTYLAMHLGSCTEEAVTFLLDGASVTMSPKHALELATSIKEKVMEQIIGGNK